jgi:hypothetical protein
MPRVRLHEVADFWRLFLGLAIPPAAARVAVIIGGGCIRRQFDFGGVGDGACGHGGSGFLGLGH